MKLFLFLIVLNFSIICLENSTEANTASLEKKSEIFEEVKDLQCTNNSLLEKILSRYGYILIHKQNSPKLYNLIVDLCIKFNINVPEIIILSPYYYGACAIEKIPFFRILMLGREFIGEFKENELTAVIAHELAHFKCYHDLKTVLITVLYIVYVSKLANHLDKKFNSSILNISFNMVCVLPLRALLATLYRVFFEKEADLVSVKTTGNKQDLIDALTRLGVESFSQSDKSFKSKLIKLLFVQHPTIKERIEYINLEA